MTHPGLPSVRRRSDSPHPGPHELGVWIVSSPLVQGPGPHLLLGTYRVPEAAARAAGVDLHKALVLVVEAVDRHLAVNPFQEHAVFADDEERSDLYRTGYFAVDLAELLERGFQGAAYVRCSVGALVSEALYLTFA